MKLRYADKDLERQCVDSKYAQRKRGVQLAKSLLVSFDVLKLLVTCCLVPGTGKNYEATGQASGPVD